MTISRVTIPGLFLLAACGASEPAGPQPPVATITLELSHDLVFAATPVNSQVILRSADGEIVTRDISWTSSDAEVATVSPSGKVSPIGAGDVSITATSEGKSASAPLTVMTSVAQVTVTGLSSVTVGQTYQFTTHFLDAGGQVIQRPVRWSVNNPVMATISANGRLVPLMAGTFVVRATVENINYDRTVTATTGK